MQNNEINNKNKILNNNINNYNFGEDKQLNYISKAKVKILKPWNYYYLKIFILILFIFYDILQT